VTLDLHVNLEYTLDARSPGDNREIPKFGRNRAICLVVKAICAKRLQTDRRTDRRRMPRDCISSWNELTRKLSYRKDDRAMRPK